MHYSTSLCETELGASCIKVFLNYSDLAIVQRTIKPRFGYQISAEIPVGCEYFLDLWLNV